MTSLSENEPTNEINLASKLISETSDNDQVQDKLDQKEQSMNLMDTTGDNRITNGVDNNDVLINTNPSIVATDEERQQQENETTDPIVNNDQEENRSKKSFNSEVKYSSTPYQRESYYLQDPPYGSAPYYYYSLPPPPSVPVEKPEPLMFIPTQKSSTSPTPRDNSTGNSTPVSPQNLPPRLRQTSTTENESNSQISSTTQSTAPPSASTTTNGRRHRSILPRGSNNYYSPHPPPPLMATPPGVLYTYPPAVHPSGHIAYNIRPPDDFELLAFQQQMMTLPPGSILWPTSPTGVPPHGHPLFPPYAVNGPLPPAYMFTDPTMAQSTNSFLNPEAAEWVPPVNGTDSSSETPILIDDEINFPPLNSTINNTQTTANTKDSSEDNTDQTDTSSETISTNDTLNDNPPISTDISNASSQSNTKIESTNTLSSSQDNTNKSLPSSSTKLTPMTYSTVTSQLSENNKSNKNNTHHLQQPTNHVHNQLPPRDRTAKQRPQIPSAFSPSKFNSRRRPPFDNNRRTIPRNPVTSENNSLPKQPQPSEITDDWIEVKSKKTKKFDRVINENSSEKSISDEQIPKSLSPPLSLNSTGDNTTTMIFTSEDDFDEKDSHDSVMITNTNVSNDYNQTILDDIHRRLDNHERLLIIMRGCPGSGKSSLAKSLNQGYNGVILSADDYFTDNSLSIYTFDSNKLSDAHRFNRQQAADALRRNLSPIIIDNTNTQVWEMKPYVAMGKEAGYDILLVEPQTPWRYKARELFKRNLHNLSLRRIKEMLDRFERNVTVQSIIDQLPSDTKSNTFIPSEEQNHEKDQTILDPILTPKKFYDTIDDSLILDDVRLCINDMILFLTSNFFQTTRPSQSSTPLSVSFHDLSLISSPSSTTSLPSAPSTPHPRFHRPLARFPSTTSPDHSFNTEHILRLPTSTFSRCLETNNLTPPPSASPNNLGKKRRKNKNKQQPNELLLNVNNNNSNSMADEQETIPQQTFTVFLPEDGSDFVVIDEENTNDWIDTVNRSFGLQINSLSDHSATIPSSQKQLTDPKTSELMNIIRTELTKPSHRPCVSTKDIAIQCLSDEFNSPITQSDVILIGHLSPSSMQTVVTPFIATRPGSKECGSQADLNDHNIELLMEIYADRLSSESIEQFYELCHSDIQWTCLQIDEYLQNNHETTFSVPTLRQLSLEKLNQWNEQIKSTNPYFDSKSIDDLLEDINDGDIFEELPIVNTTVEFSNVNQIQIPWSMINSLEEIFGELPDKSPFSSNNNGIFLPFDDILSRNIYQALQRSLVKSTEEIKPVIEDSIKNESKKKNKKKKKNDNNSQKWKLPEDSQPHPDMHTNGIPSFRQIMNEEEQAAKSQKSKQKDQLDYATEHKLKELVRHFPSFDSDLLYDIFRENEYDYDLTYICISTMFDENASVIPVHRTSPLLRSNPVVQTNVEPVLEPYETLRHDALRHAQQRKEFYTKAHQANRHGMSGVASFYIRRASEETQLMKDANRAACERLSRWKLKQFQQTQRLDLHGLHSNEALHLFQQIEQELNEGNRRTTPKSIEIITGYGKNSIYGGGHGRIRSTILAYFQQRNYKYSEPNKGVILLQLTNT